MPALSLDWRTEKFQKISKLKSDFPIYATNKIRKKLQYLHGRFGYPTRFMQYIGYYSGIALWVPDGWIILPWDTAELWVNEHENRWKFVYIANIIEDIDDVATMQGQIWKKLGSYIYGMSHLIDTLINFDPAQFLSKLATKTKYPIYSNLGFYNTINDKMIRANYEEIIEDIYHDGEQINRLNLEDVYKL